MASLIPAAGSTGSGSLTLQGPSTSSTQTVTIPDATGTMMVSGNMPAFSAYMGANQNSITAVTQTKVAFNTITFDTASCFNTSTYRFTPTVAGYYQISANVQLQSTTATDSISLSVYKNGAIYKSSGSAKPAGNSFPVPTLSVLVYCNGSTDYLEIYAYLDVITSGNLYSNGDSFRSQFSGVLVRAA
jgi:hypothetical protein